MNIKDLIAMYKDYERKHGADAFLKVKTVWHGKVAIRDKY